MTVDGRAEYLGFVLGDQLFGVGIHSIQELRCWEPVTRIPNTPACVRGAINLRGAIVPVIDLRRCIGLPPAEPAVTTVVIVLNVRVDGHGKTIGVVVDSVSDVLAFTAGEAVAAPEFGTAVDGQFIAGLAQLNERMVTLLAMDRLLAVCVQGT